MISFQNVSKIYPCKVIGLENVNLEIASGEFVIIVGKTGSGKSTLLKLINKEEEPTHGVISFNGINLTTLHQADVPLFRQKFGTIFQDIRLIHSKNVFENIAFAMEMVGANDEDVARDVPRILDMVGLKQKYDRFPNELSGGEKQKVAIARAMIHRPDVILADEPTGSLDAYNTRDVIDSLEKLNELGTTVILATHNERVVNLLRKRVVTLDNGQIVRDQAKGKFVL